MKREGPVLSTKWKLTREALSTLKMRIQEAAAWSQIAEYSSEPKDWLRTPELCPKVALPVDIFPGDVAVTYRKCIEQVAKTRAGLIVNRSIRIPNFESAMEGAALVGHLLHACTLDEIPNAESGAFDLLDQPGWDSWVYFLGPKKCPGDNRCVQCTAVYWIDKKFVDEIEKAMFSSTDCLVWIPPDRLGL